MSQFFLVVVRRPDLDNPPHTANPAVEVWREESLREYMRLRGRFPSGAGRNIIKRVFPLPDELPLSLFLPEPIGGTG